MKLKVLQQIMFISKYGLIGVFLQCIFFNMILASNTLAQKSIEEIYLNLKSGDKKVEEMFTEIERNTDFTFSYRRSIVRGKKIEDQWEGSQSLGDILRKLSKGTDLQFKRIGDNIFVKKKEFDSGNGQSVVIEEQESIEVSGKVTDENGEGLPGAAVIVKGTTVGAITNFEGNFKISVSENATLIISFIGYISQEIVVDNRSVIDVQMVLDATQLEDVVVIGYGTQNKREITGSVSSVKSADIQRTSVAGLDQAISGRAGGVHVLQNSGAPGGNVSVRIRGVGTPGNSEPLYVIDGVPVFNDNSNRSQIEFGQSSNVLNTINPSDIESIEILKDGASASIYGSRSANGVVLITTKSGTAGKLKVDINSYVGVQSLRKKVDVLNAQEYAKVINEIFRNAVDAADIIALPRYSNPSSLGVGTDWQDAIFRNAAISNTQLAISGGSEKSQFLISGGYFSQKGIIENSSLDRYSFRFNSKHKISDKLSFGNNIMLSNISEDVIFSDQNTEGVIAVALGSHPTNPVFNPDGSYAGSTDPSPYGYVRNNALAIAKERTNEFSKYRFLGNVFAKYEIIDGLKYKLNLAADFIYSGSNNFTPTFSNGNIINPTASATRFDSNELIWLIEHTLSYSKTINDSHDFTLLVGLSQQESKLEAHVGRKDNFPVNDLIYLNAGTTGDGAEGAASEWALQSYFGRINYDFNDKYLFSASVRTDGSSRFSDGNRYGVFPAVSAGWLVSEESFLDDNALLSELKFRASWGQSGNQEIGLFQFLPVLATNGSYILGSGGSVSPGVFLPQIANSEITWETTTQTDIGIDLGLFNNRLNVTIDYYDKFTTDILLERVLPLSSGLSLSGFSEFGTAAPNNPIVNTGEVRNKGIELELSYKKSEGDFQWEIGGNITTVDNTVEDLGVGSAIINSNVNFETRTEVGQPIASFYGYVTDGIFQTAQEVDNHAVQTGAAPGDIRFKDLNDDNIIDDQDRTYIGNPIPDFYYGLNLQLFYKNFDVSVFFQGVNGNEIYNIVQLRNENLTSNDNKYSSVLDRWTGPGTSNSIPRADASSTNNNTRISDRYIHDGSYLRMKNIQIGYSLPSNILNKWGISKARFYVSAQNVFVKTNYKIGHDPEIGAFNQNNLDSGIDRGAYPIPRTFLVGLNLSF